MLTWRRCSISSMIRGQGWCLTVRCPVSGHRCSNGRCSNGSAVAALRYAGTEHIATYIIKHNINYTNVCVTACKFCAFYAAPQGHRQGLDARGLDDILRRCARRFVELGGTQIIFQADTAGLRRRVLREALRRDQGRLPAAGHPLPRRVRGRAHGPHLQGECGGGHPADPRRQASTPSRAPVPNSSGPPRKAIAPLKESGERWLEVVETAHGLGVESTSTMLMGTGETNAERIEHLRMIRDVQDRTGGFRAFIPYTYQPENNHLKGRTQATLFEYLRMIAIARLFMDNIAHIQGSWLTTGKEVGRCCPALRRGRPRLDHAGGERRLLHRRQAPLQPHGDHRPDPQGRPRARPADHDVRAHRSPTTTRRTTRSTSASCPHLRPPRSRAARRTPS